MAITEALEDRLILLGDTPSPVHGVAVKPSPRRVRAVLANTAVADSSRVLLMLETQHLPVYYFPITDVRMDLLEPSDQRTRSPYKGDASYWHVRVGDRLAENAAWAYREPVAGRPDVREYLAFYWSKMDAWYEEDDEVFVHPRDPYHRVIV